MVGLRGGKGGEGRSGIAIDRCGTVAQRRCAVGGDVAQSSHALRNTHQSEQAAMERSGRVELQQRNQEVFVFGSFTEAELLHFQSLALGEKGAGSKRASVGQSTESLKQLTVQGSHLAEHSEQQAEGDLKSNQSHRIEISRVEREANQWDKQLWPPEKSQGIGQPPDHANAAKHGQVDLQQSTQSVQSVSEDQAREVAWSMPPECTPKQKVEQKEIHQDPAAKDLLKEAPKGDPGKPQGSLLVENMQPQTLPQREPDRHQVQRLVHSSPSQQGVQVSSRGQLQHCEVDSPTKQEGVQRMQPVAQQAFHQFPSAGAQQTHLYPSHPVHPPQAPTVHLLPGVPVVFGTGEVIVKRDMIPKGVATNGTGMAPYFGEVPRSSTAVVAAIPSAMPAATVPVLRNGLGLGSGEATLGAVSGSVVRRDPSMSTAVVPSGSVSITAAPALATSATAVGTSEGGLAGIGRPGAMSLAPNVAVVGVWRGASAPVNGAPGRVVGGGHPSTVIGAGAHTCIPTGTHPTAVVGAPHTTPAIPRMHPTIIGATTAHAPAAVGPPLPPSTGGPHPAPVIVAARSLPSVIGGGHSHPIVGGSPIVLNSQPPIPALARAVATPAVSTAWAVGGTTVAPATPPPPSGFVWNDTVPLIEHSPFAVIQPTSGPPAAFPWTGTSLHAPMIASQSRSYLSAGSGANQPTFVPSAPTPPANGPSAAPVTFGWPSTAGAGLAPVSPPLLVPSVGTNSVPWVTAVLTPPNKSPVVSLRTGNVPKVVVASSAAVPNRQDSGKAIRGPPGVTLWPVTPVKKSQAGSSEREAEAAAVGEVVRTDGHYLETICFDAAKVEVPTATEPRTTDITSGGCSVAIQSSVELGAVDGKGQVASLGSDVVKGSSSVIPCRGPDPRPVVSESAECFSGGELISNSESASERALVEVCELNNSHASTNGADVVSSETLGTGNSSAGTPGSSAAESEKTGDMSGVHTSGVGEVDTPASAPPNPGSSTIPRAEANGECKEPRAADWSSNSAAKSKSWAALVGVPPSEDGYIEEVRANVSVRGVGAGSGKAGMMSMASKSQVGGVAVSGKGNGRIAEEGTRVTAMVHQEQPAVYGSVWLKSLREFEQGKRVQPIPRGLMNTGNSCFLNSTLQALLSCSPFFHLIRVLATQKIPTDGKFPVLKAFVDFLAEFQLPQQGEVMVSKDGARDVNGFDKYGNRTSTIDVGRPFVPAMFENVLMRFSPNQRARGPGRTRQEDAQEFLSYCLDCLHQELLMLQEEEEGSGSTVGRDGAGAVRAARQSSASSEVIAGMHDEDEWETVGPKNRTAVTRTHEFPETALSSIFGGQLRSEVRTQGSKPSATVQPFMLLQLDIMPESVKTVEDALHHFTARETLDGYKTKGRAEVPASKSVRILQLPRVLVLHLKRFSYDAQGVGKVHKMVRFPLNLTLHRDLLVPSSVTVGTGGISGSHREVRQYELVSIVSHHGKDAATGHYTTDAKQGDNRWLRFDDCHVTSVPQHRVLDNDEAYLLVYKRWSML
ncbi:hypothetical protein CBR_g66808 [Chara braunii]|uniref:ubiquitinyl hydrolase 1 n=1 Tax=Chara braunii TaxID=69332 RepID=A0A388K9Q9_CHABU|nr:hypothetical protein CBR_g66808 [Chara braunii]|eukprot:GBG66673.1 hypothetical protein CBR_g66808 [Chara braunii]